MNKSLLYFRDAREAVQRGCRGPADRRELISSSTRIRYPCDSQLFNSAYAGVAPSGCMAGIIQTVVTTPVDLIKVRLQTQQIHGTGLRPGPMRLARAIWYAPHAYRACRM